MAVDTIITELRFNNVMATVAIPVDIKTYDVAHVLVLYGNAALTAVQGTDYTIELAEDFEDFNVTPTAALITKITNLINADITEVNTILVMRIVPLTSDFLETDAFIRRKITNEFDLTTMRIQQLSTKAQQAYDGFQEITYDIDAIHAERIATEAAATAAEAAAAALGNQAYTFDTVTQAQGTTIPVGVKSARTMGVAASGDAPQLQHFRVPTQPAGANKFRSTDRFLPNGGTDAGNGGWWQMVLEGATDLRKFGGFGGGDITTALNNALAAGNVIVPPGVYTISNNILFPSNRLLVIMTGVFITTNEARWTGYLPGGGNVHVVNDGELYFHNTATAASMFPTGGWGGGGAERGCIEFGGSLAAQATNFSWTGNGRVYSDYPFTTVAATGIYDLDFQINRKGIAYFNCSRVLVEGQLVDHIYGEAVYHNGGALLSDTFYDVRFRRNRVVQCAFDALNFNTFVADDSMIIEDNTITQCFIGVEASTGSIRNNRITNCGGGINTGGGGGVNGMSITNNRIKGTIYDGINVGFDLGGSSVQGVDVSHNRLLFLGGYGIILEKLDSFTCNNNFVQAWAQNVSAWAITLLSHTTNGQACNNFGAIGGVHSIGSFTNAGTANQVANNITV